MIESAIVERSTPCDVPTPAKPIAPGTRSRPRRDLSFFDYLFRIPLGFLWLFVLAIVAVPVVIAMTLLYYLAQATGPLARTLRARRDAHD